MNSRELVDFQQEMFKVYHTPFATLDKTIPLNEVKELLYNREAGLITEEELNARLEEFRNTDNRKQLTDNFLRRVAVSQQHNISLSGGSEKHTYNASANYTQNLPFEKTEKNEKVGYNIKNSFKFYDWLRADIGLIGSYNFNNSNNGFVAQDYLYGGRPSYKNIFDNAGNEIPWLQNKSQLEMNRLIKLGLYDEAYYPLQELNRSTFTSKSNYTNLNIGLNFKIIDGLSFDTKYQMEKTLAFNKNFRNKDSFVQRTTINNATKIDPITNKITYLIPQGGYINETRGEGNSYTLRTQINYNKTIKNLHEINSIIGAERRAVKTTSTFLEKWGYDDINLSHKYIDEVLLSNSQSGTQSPSGSYMHKVDGYPTTFREIENRFVSFYGNASYEYDKRYIISGSIRMDQSNLFGTDPRFQYKPLWSAGISWNLSNEKFLKSSTWINHLSLRATYGINGNIAKESGPYLIAEDRGLNSFTQEYSSDISSPPNSGLRWEKTEQKNIGIDFRLFNNRISGSIEYYDKFTRDLLGRIASDPTIGWSNLTINYASLYNRGYEINLNTINVQLTNFSWTSTINFSYNKNKIVDLQNSLNTVTDYVLGTNNRVGKPMGSLYSTRWAGLDATGKPQVFKEDNTTIVKNAGNLVVKDLVYSGTTVPPYAASLTNNFNYKGLYFSFMFIFYGGHVMRDVMPTYIVNPNGYVINTNKNITNYWKTPGDEKDPDKSPAILRNASTNISDLWYAADKHILKADYLKLREITFGYQLPKQIYKKLGVSSLSVNAQIQNLWYWSANNKNLEPESWNGTSMDPAPTRSNLRPKTYTLGFAVKF